MTDGHYKSNDPTPEFGEISADEERDMMASLVEEDAVDLQCLIDGDSDRDRAAVMREEVNIQREVYQILRAEALRRDAPLMFRDAIRVARERLPDVSDDSVSAAYDLLCEDVNNS